MTVVYSTERDECGHDLVGEIVVILDLTGEVACSATFDQADVVASCPAGLTALSGLGQIEEAQLLQTSDATKVPVEIASGRAIHPPPAVKQEPPSSGFMVFDAPWNEDGVAYAAGVYFFGRAPGKPTSSPLGPIWVCAPLHICAVTTDGRGGSFGRLLSFKDSLGQWREWPMPMEHLAGDGADVRRVLLSMGLTIAPSGRALLSTYLQAELPQRQILCVAQTGWVRGRDKVFVLPDETFGSGASEVTYQTLDRAPAVYACAGSPEAWKAEVAAMAQGNPLLVLALSLAFAGPLLKLCNAESGGVHLYGPSSAGKSSLLDASCSVWGGPGYRRSWRATSNGMEGAAGLSNDSLLALDEISECEPSEVGAIVYSLGNGLGKQRATRTGAARPVMQWNCCVLSSGERTLGTAMAEGGRRIKAGQTVRLLDIPVDRVHGAWDDLHGMESGAAFSDALKKAAATHYGHAGRAFLRHLTADAQVNVGALWATVKQDLRFASTPGDGQAARAAARLSLVAVAGELATRYGVTGWAAGEATAAAAVAFDDWLIQRGSLNGNLEREQVTSRLLDFITRHGESRFSAFYPQQATGLVVHDRVGWWREIGGHRTYLFTPASLMGALRDFDKSLILRVLEEVGAVSARGADGKLSRPFKVDGRTQRLYEVDPVKLERNSD